MGNETSLQSMSYGEKLDNDVVVNWKKIQCNNPFPGRDGHCSCAVKNDLYVFGGVLQTDDSECVESNELLIFNIDECSWRKAEAKGDIPAPRSGATLSAVGKWLFLFGGLSRNSGWFNNIYVFDTESSTWEKAETEGTSPCARDKHGATVIGDEIYIFGGFGPQSSVDLDDEDEEEEQDEEEKEGAQFRWFNDLFVFNTVTRAWSNPLQMNLGVPTPRAAHGMCAVKHYLVIFGGRDAEGRTNDLHIFNTVTRKWETELVVAGRQPEPRSFHTATAVADKRVVILGGRSPSNEHFNDFHIFDTDTREWLQPSVEGEVPKARGVHSATVVGDSLVVFGGSSRFDSEMMQCREYHNDVYVLKTAALLSGSSKQKPQSELSAAKTEKPESSSSSSSGPSPPKRQKTETKSDSS